MPTSKPKLLVGFSGSVASIKAAQLVAQLKEVADVRVVLTTAAKHFVDLSDAAFEGVAVFDDASEWSAWRAVGDPVVHIEVRPATHSPNRVVSFA